jgi:hypothetical protein
MYRRVLPVRVIGAGLLFGRCIWRELSANSGAEPL